MLVVHTRSMEHAPPSALTACGMMQVLVNDAAVFHGDFLSRKFELLPFAEVLDAWQVCGLSHTTCTA